MCPRGHRSCWFMMCCSVVLCVNTYAMICAYSLEVYVRAKRMSSARCRLAQRMGATMPLLMVGARLPTCSIYNETPPVSQPYQSLSPQTGWMQPKGRLVGGLGDFAGTLWTSERCVYGENVVFASSLPPPDSATLKRFYKKTNCKQNDWVKNGLRHTHRHLCFLYCFDIVVGVYIREVKGVCLKYPPGF